MVMCLCKNGSHLDIGCSTGSLVKELAEMDIDSTGIDVSKIIQSEDYLIMSDFLTYEFEKKYNVISSIFFLQFLTPSDRVLAIKKIDNLLKAKGVLIVGEKIFLDNPLINNISESMYLNSKLKNFTGEEILNKKISLARSMFLKTKSELIEELRLIGSVEIFWQDYNFLSCVVVKE